MAESEVYRNLAIIHNAIGEGRFHATYETTVTLSSGRSFKFNHGRYPVHSGMTPSGALELARKIFRDNYRESKTDRKRPEVNAEREVVRGLVMSMLKTAEHMRQIQSGLSSELTEEMSQQIDASCEVALRDYDEYEAKLVASQNDLDNETAQAEALSPVPIITLGCKGIGQR